MPDDVVQGGAVPSGNSAGHGRAARSAALRAALLDEGTGRDGSAPGGEATGRHLLAAETAAAALADVPSAGRVGAARLGVFMADIPQPGTADMRHWVQRYLGLDGHGGGAPAPEAGHRLAAERSAAERSATGHGGAPHVGAERSGADRSGAEHGGMPPGTNVKDLVRGTIGKMTPGRETPAVNGDKVANAVLPGGLHCSLRAVTEACEALNSGEFDLALAGGVATGIEPWLASPDSALTADSIRVYDASPTGTLPGEGCGVVALVRDSDARRLGLPVYAEIAGWHAAGPTTPQRAVVPTAYLRAGVDPADVQFIEGHGAATANDDLDELAVLAEVIGHRASSAVARCALGSISANIGDTRAAAGVAALLKVAFAMTAETIPPSTGCVQPNRLLLADTVPFRLPRAPEPWPQTPVLLAAVNSLGTSPHPDAPRSGPVHVILRRERDHAHRVGRRRKPVLLPQQT